MKICTTCKMPKSLDQFNKNSVRKDGLQNFCRDCGKARSKRYYEENPEKHQKVVLEKKQQLVKRNHRLICEYLSIHPCVDCKEDDIVVLEFDHLKDKVTEVSQLVQGGYTWKRIQKEIDKCEVVCANCHKRRTASRSENYRTRYLKDV